MLATLLRRTPTMTLTSALRAQLVGIRKEMEVLHSAQSHRGLFSAYLCALVEVGVAIALRRMQQHEEDKDHDDDEDEGEDEEENEEGGERERYRIARKRETKKKERKKKNWISSSVGRSYNGANHDGLLSEQRWFLSLVEVARIMESLVSPPLLLPAGPSDDMVGGKVGGRGGGGRVERMIRKKERQLPSSFLFARDTFLKFILVAETVTVESDHPYQSPANSGKGKR